MRRVVVVGLGPAGLWSAISARVADSSAEVVVLSDEKYLTYSRCGLPFVIGGEIGSFEELVITSIDKLKSLRIQVFLESRVVDVDGDEVVYEHRGELHRIKFSSLVLATGSKPFIPPIPGIDAGGVYSLRTINDGVAISKASMKARRALVIGAGAIGLEVAEALAERGLEVTVAEIMPRVLPAILDGDMARILSQAIRSSGVNLMLNSRVEEIIGNPTVSSAVVGEAEVPCDLVVVATGVRPNVDLARKVGVSIGATGGIETDEFMRTSIEGIYAAGDCAETKHLVTGRPFTPFLGSVAYRQGKVAGANAAGSSLRFAGSLGSTVLRVFGFEVGFTGLTCEQAKGEGIRTVVGKVKWLTKAEYYPGAREIVVKLVFRADDGKLIGGQIVGGEAVAQRINLLAAAIACGMDAESIASIDTCYSPPVADAIEPITRAAEIALRKLRK